MAKIGKSSTNIDPFKAGKGAFGAIDEVLGDLDDQPETQEELPVSKTPSKPKPSPTNRNRAPQASSTGPTQKATKKAPKKESASRKRACRLLATEEEMMTWQRAAMRLAAETGARIDFSKVTRALWEVFLRHEEDILRNIPEGTQWDRPSNADTVGLAELDERLANLVNEGLMVAGRRPKNFD